MAEPIRVGMEKPLDIKKTNAKQFKEDMKMKKVFATVLTVMTVAAVSGCGNSASTATTAAATTAAVVETTAAAETTTAATGETTAAAAAGETVTSDQEPVVTIGEIDKSKYEAPVLVTSFGQSTDAAMLDNVMGRLGVEYTYNSVATAEDVPNYKTIIITVGASTKGLGAAGISEADETARAEAFMEAVKNSDCEVICCHIGGNARRGALSDKFADMVLTESSYLIVKEDGDYDGKFTGYAKENNIPITLVQQTKNTVTVFTDLFAK